MRQVGEDERYRKQFEQGGMAGWVQRWWRGRAARVSRLTLVERIAIGPRQALMLVEVDGLPLLVATAAEGATTIFPLKDVPMTRQAAEEEIGQERAARVGLGLVDCESEKPARVEGRLWSRAGAQGRVSW